MAPLCLRDLLNDNRCDSDLATFSGELKTAKEMGVTAVSVDVWWGLVEKDQDNRFNWDYYDRIVKAIQTAGLHWVPILSFHRCGGNVGDSCDIPIPPWVWTHYRTQQVNPEDLKYRSEKGNLSEETVSLWMDPVVLGQYEEFMRAFVNHFAGLAGVAEMTDEINISMGPAGELRYPSYNSHDAYSYPGRGFFQAYSNPARQDFRRYVLEKYGTLAKVNRSWQTSLDSAAQIAPPQDDPPANGSATSFVNRRDYEKTQYGRDFIDWYHDSLIKHGKRMLDSASKSLSGPFAAKDIGMKIPGIHWQICGNAPAPRIAEITAGLIATSGDYGSDRTGHGYLPLLEMISQASSRTVLYFTCLEMDNSGCAQGSDYSEAKALVFWAAQAAAKAGVTIKGENALRGLIRNDSGWNNIENAFCYAPFAGLTALRVGEVTATQTGHDRYQCLIKRMLSR